MALSLDTKSPNNISQVLVRSPLWLHHFLANSNDRSMSWTRNHITEQETTHTWRSWAQAFITALLWGLKESHEKYLSFLWAYIPTDRRIPQQNTVFMHVYMMRDWGENPGPHRRRQAELYHQATLLTLSLHILMIHTISQHGTLKIKPQTCEILGDKQCPKQSRLLTPSTESETPVG